MPNRIAAQMALYLLLTIFPAGLSAHVSEGAGKTLQLYSYYTSSPPKINACLTDATTNGGVDAIQGTDNDEWKDAYIREIKIISMDNVDTLNGTLFFMNDDSFLYIGITTDFNNSSNNTYIEFSFDQGIGGGNHNDLLDGGGAGVNNGEYSARVYPNKGYAQQKAELSFDGTGWVQQNNGVELFTGLGRNFGTSFVQAEFKIPLDGNPAPGDTRSHLNVTGTSEVGVFISFYSQGGNKLFRWPETNGDINNATTAPGWFDLRLGVERSYVTFYSTVNVNGNPVIDGNIGGGVLADDAWRGSYRRNLTLTDFAGSTINATLYSTENNSGNNVYVGIKVFDNDNDAGDYCQIYQEEDPSASPAVNRNYLLDNGTENALVADANAFTLADDRYWDGGLETWSSDATNTAQNGRGAWYGSGNFYEYEFLIDRFAGNDGDNQDIYMADGSLMGFNIKYHDAAGSGSDYFWEFAPNADAIEIDPNQNVYVATGWPDLQLGAPYVQTVFPEDDADVEGTVNMRIYAEDDNGVDGIDSATFYRKSASSIRYALTRIAGTGEWSGTWDVSALTNGPDTLVFEVGDDDGIVINRLVKVTIANGTGAAAPPTVTITGPAAGTVVQGNVTIAFTAAATGATIATREISIDGAAYTATTTGTSHIWNTGALAEGSHTVQIKVTDSNGRSTATNVTTYIVKNSPAVTLTAPVADSTVSGTLVVAFTATPVSPATVFSTAISIDGGAYRATATGSNDTLDTRPLAEGAHTLQVRATDSNGKTGLSELIKFNVRNSPSVMVTTPSADSVVSGALIVMFTATPVPPATIASTSLSIDGGAYRTTTTGSNDTLDTQPLAEGAHTILVRATDSNGKTGVSELIKFNVRNNPSVTLLSPHADTIISGTVTVRFIAQPVAPATIARREVYMDGALLDTADTDSTFAWNTVRWNDGQHTVQVRIVDSNGKQAVSDIVSVTLFNTPVVRITDPVDSSVIFGIDTIRFTVDCAPGTSGYVTEISFNGGEWVPSSSSLSHIWVTTDLRDGTHIVQVRVNATNGKTGYSQIRAYAVNNAPTATIISPVAGEALSGSYFVRFRIDAVAPANIGERLVSVDGGPWSDSLINDTSFVMNTVGWKNGTHSIQVRGIDDRGRIGDSRTLSFIVDNEAPLAADPKAVYGAMTTTAKSGAEILVTVLVKDNLAGLKTDSAVVLTSASINESEAVTCLMRDDGQGGDKVKGDNVYSALVKVATDSTGSIGYLIRAVDLLGNNVTLTSAIMLDNTAPATAFSLDPVPENGADVRSGATYFRRLIMKGSYSDGGGSGLSQVFLAVKNDSGAYVNTAPVVLAPEDSLFSSIIELIPGNNTIMLCAVDKAGNRDSTLGQVVYHEPKATKIVDRRGGTIDNPDGASAVVPKDALLSQVEATIVPVEPVEQRKPLNKTLTLLNVAHDFGPDGTVFRKPVTLTLPYTEADLDQDQDGRRDIDPAKLIVVFWDGGTWLAAGPGSVDTTARSVTVAVNHFTIFDLAVSTADNLTDLVAFWSANPVKQGKGAYFTYNVPENGSVSLRVVDMAGDLVCQLIPAKTPASAETVPRQVAWRGQNTAGKFAGAGLYVYVFTFTPDATKTPEIIRKPIGLLY